MPERDSRQISITGATYLEPEGEARHVDVLIDKGEVAEVVPRVWGERALPTATRAWRIDATGSFLAPGFIDMHTHLREPGEEQKETIASGADAAAAGGFTTVVAMANTSPPVDSVETLRRVTERARHATVRVLTVAAVTRGLEGRELTEMEALADAGAIAFSDDGRNGYDLDLAVAAVRRASALSRPVLVHAQDEETCRDGQADPAVARPAGLEPWPCSAEAAAVRRAIEACRLGGGRVHIQHVSCAAAVELIDQARRAGLPVTAEATPHHLVLTSAILSRPQPSKALDPMAKVNPPLRSERDRQAVVEGLVNGVIDAVATDHAPHEVASKDVEFAEASFGFSGLETALSLCLELVESNQVSLRRLIDCLTLGPWRALGTAAGIPEPSLQVGQVADLVLFDSKGIWTVDPQHFHSRGHNTPLAGRELKGHVLLTISAGKPVMSRWFAGAA